MRLLSIVQYATTVFAIDEWAVAFSRKKTQQWQHDLDPKYVDDTIWQSNQVDHLSLTCERSLVRVPQLYRACR